MIRAAVFAIMLADFIGYAHGYYEGLARLDRAHSFFRLVAERDCATPDMREFQCADGPVYWWRG